MPKKGEMSKKGAIELSMSTIIIVVIGVALLIMGFAFLDKIKGMIFGITEDVEKLKPDIGKEDLTKPVTVSPSSTLNVEQGKSKELTVYVLNKNPRKQPVTITLKTTIGKTGSLNPQDVSCEVMGDSQMTLNSGQADERPLTIIDRGSPLTGADSYSCTVEAIGGDLGGSNKDILPIKIVEKKSGLF